MDGSKNEFDLSAAFARSNAAETPRVEIDVQKYQHYLDDCDLSEVQKAQFLEALWSIIATFIDLGYGIHPIQEVCGKPDKLSDEWSAGPSDALNCDPTKKQDQQTIRHPPSDGGTRSSS